VMGGAATSDNERMLALVAPALQAYIDGSR
jgi:hypothetical protein